MYLFHRKNIISILRFLIPIIILSFCWNPLISQKNNPDNFCLSDDEMRLFEQINKLREDYDQKSLQLSASLSYVAKLHVEDLFVNHPDTSICGLSSWSDKGDWKACCYNPYVLNEECMWAKPKELTSYPFRGYELVTYFEDDFTIDSVIHLWSGTKAVLDLVLTRGNYTDKNWICMGIGINKDYVSVWFGQRADQSRRPKICDSTTKKAVIEEQHNSSTDGFFYLIFGSFDDINDAKEALRKIKKDNFPDAEILVKDGLNRIYIGKFDTLKAAMFAKQNLSYSYQDAWILKK